MNFNEYKELPPNKKIEYFIDTLSLTNRTPEYYVNWDKVVRNTKKYELELNTLNFLIGKENIIEEAKKLFTKQPELLKAIPSLIANRENHFDVLLLHQNEMDVVEMNFANIDAKEIDRYVWFMEESGLLLFLKNEANRSLVDYVYGVESGLDSNARKNRSGTTMENILTNILQGISNRIGYLHMEQATASRIYEEWGVQVSVDKSQRRFDGALFDPVRNKTYVFETNYYGGGGSKLKSVAGEFQTLNNLVKTSKDNVTFIWITDGQGWRTARIPLTEAMATIEHIYSLKMIDNGFLYSVLNE